MKFKAPFILPTKDFKNSEKVFLDVTTNIEQIFEGEVTFKVVMPDFMFNELADSEPRFNTKPDINNNRNIEGCFIKYVTRKFQKTQTSPSLEVLKDFMSKMTCHLNDKYSVETETSKKKIFISFTHKLEHDKNQLNGAYKGMIVGQRFQYFIGYEIMTTRFSDSLFDKSLKKRYISKIKYATGTTAHTDTGFQEVDGMMLQLPSHNQSVEDFENSYIIIDHTNEREEFCKKIQDTFVRVNNDLSDFLNSITNEKIDLMISNSESMPHLLK